MKAIRPYLTIICILSLSMVSSAQTSPRPRGQFLHKSIKIGEPVSFSFSYSHPVNELVLFPDSSYNFYPFEYINKQFYRTRTVLETSTDSVVYTLRTFEPDSVQRLRLPVYIIENEDTLLVHSLQDSVQLVSSLQNKTDQQLKAGIAFAQTNKSFNYPYFIAGIVAILIFSGLLYGLLGKTILRNYRLYILRSAHKGFTETFEELQNEFERDSDYKTLEKMLTLWKNYLSRLENIPLNTFTTTEIIARYNKENLRDSLQSIDRTIYGGVPSNDLLPSLTVLRSFSNKRFKRKRKQLRNA